MVLLDTRTLDGDFRLSVFGETVEDLLEEFFRWVNEYELRPEDIWYSDVFKMDPEGEEPPRRIGVFELETDSRVTMAAKDDGLSAYAKRLPPLKFFLKKIKKFLNK